MDIVEEQSLRSREYEVTLYCRQSLKLRRDRVSVASVEWGAEGWVGGVQLEQLGDDAPGGVPIEVGVDVGEELVVGPVRSSVQSPRTER